MATEAQILANRANAQFSTGPRTAAGKQISSANSCQHCLTGGPDVASGESQEAFDEHIKTTIGQYGATKPRAIFAVVQIGKCTWKLLRCDRWEAQILASSEHPFEDETVAKKLERIEKYRQCIERSFHRWVKEWRNIIAEELQAMKISKARSKRSLWEIISSPNPTSIPRTVPEQHRE